jgi:hypothetical protein
VVGRAKLNLVFVLWIAGCASASNPQGHADLAGSATSVCPLHPEQCGGKCCGNVCAEIMLDVRNCGDCGAQCPTGQVCQAGKCGCPGNNGTACGMGQTCCGVASCKSLDSDINNCGACGNICGVGNGQTCMGGKCLCGGVACTGSQKCCNGTCSDSCATAPDMAVGNSGGDCVCATKCPLSKLCLQNSCCFEDVLLMTPGTCMDTTVCAPLTYP